VIAPLKEKKGEEDERSGMILMVRWCEEINISQG